MHRDCLRHTERNIPVFLPYHVASVADAFSNLIGLVLAQIFVILFALMLKAIFKVKKKELSAQ